jgi:hypothetical protein
MSDETPATAAGAAEPAPIDFERAEFAEPAREHVECGLCNRAIATEYWQYLGKILCGPCREGVSRSVADARRGATFGKAFLLAGGTALGCGIGYAIFVGLTNIHFALVTIGIGWAVGRVIQKVTRGFGSRRHQVLAVALTYFASSMGYFPAVVGALSKAGAPTEQTSEGAVPKPASTAPAAGADPGEAPPPPPPPSEAPSGGSLAFTLVVGTVLVLGLTLAAPFFEISSGFSGVLGLLIIFFGLRTAWRVSKGLDGLVTGPHQIRGAAGS